MSRSKNHFDFGLQNLQAKTVTGTSTGMTSEVLHINRKPLRILEPIDAWLETSPFRNAILAAALFAGHVQHHPGAHCKGKHKFRMSSKFSGVGIRNLHFKSISGNGEVMSMGHTLQSDLRVNDANSPGEPTESGRSSASIQCDSQPSSSSFNRSLC